MTSRAGGPGLGPMIVIAAICLIVWVAAMIAEGVGTQTARMRARSDQPEAMP